MAHKRLKAADMEINYKFACRCCLKSEAEFFKLDSLIDCGNDDANDNDNDASSTTKLPLLRLLLFCMRTENLPELPQYICVECRKSLQIAYYFIKNGLRAHEILCRKLCPSKLQTKPRMNGQHLALRIEAKAVRAFQDTHREKPLKGKICGEVIHNRLELKQHLRTHSESRHQCKLCNFVTLKHRQLLEHYRKSHGLTTAQIEHQLKIRRSLQVAASTTTKATTAASTETPAAAAAADDDGQVKVCTMEDMELLIPTVLTPEDFTHPQLDADQLRDIEQQLTSSSLGSANTTAASTEPVTANARGSSANMSIGAEFLVMPDGSLQQVNDAGVVFEYIDDSKNAASRATTTNTTTNVTLESLLSDSKTDLIYDAMDIDLSPMVVDNALPQITVKPKGRPAPAPASTGALKHKCKLCPKAFPTVARLKSHQLTHSHLPKFYCDQCTFYSLRSADLIQHYTSEHNICVSDTKASQVEKSPMMTAMLTDRNRIFSCDMCLFETPSGGQLRLHYSDKHLIVPSEVQLRPSWIRDQQDGNAKLKSGDANTQPDIPLGIKYPTMTQCAAATMATTTAKTTSMVQQPQAITTTTTAVTSTGGINVVVDASSLFYAATAAENVGTTAATTTATTGATATTTTDATATNSSTLAIFPEQCLATTTTAKAAITNQQEASNQAVTTSTRTTNPNTSTFGDMQEFIDNTDVAAICTIPADDMPVDGDDIVIDNNNISLDFDAENLFEEFEDVEVGEEVDDDDAEEDDEDEDDAENDDENDNNDAAADQNLLLTSDDDDVDDFDDEQSKHLQKPYCIFCNKKFTSQYKFENHMFVHRGLAPYRCELCTNLYNMKRLLIRHYKTVHKKMPTRDMVQAKGDKVAVPCTAIEKININADKNPLLMCAKCPFECELDVDMRKHLNAHHGINDGVSIHANEVFIIRKLPYECPRCIRSFAAKRTLTRHLQRSHLVDTIIEMQALQLTTSSAATTTTATTTTTLPNNASDGNKAKSNAVVESSNNGNIDVDVDLGDGGDGKCEEQALAKDTGSEMENSDTEMDTKGSLKEVINAAATTDVREAPTVAEAKTTTATVKTDASPTTTTTTTDFTPTTQQSAVSTLFPTFDFDLDFIGNVAHATTLKNNNDDSFNVASLPPPLLLNGSDKLLTAALEPSPVKDLRPRLPRTPIYVCKQCNQTFDELPKLLQHELQQHSSGTKSSLRSSYQHQCKICNASYRTVTLLNYHMKQHAQVKVPCKEFQVSTEVEPDHVQSDHRGNSGPLKCGIDGCRKTFNYKHHLKRHQTASHTPVQYICPECGRDMLTSLYLRNHMSMHRGTHSYKCPKCVRTYMRRNP
ncbi:GH22843 [Drosophila grimshawi]|uniref:GH22843 n=2 Tax=Drosophila grimshawi TaxID=7222 RepID=B4JVZ2_DROGR|nr:GH22843 [Drosophila grimshawi]